MPKLHQRFFILEKGGGLPCIYYTAGPMMGTRSRAQERKAQLRERSEDRTEEVAMEEKKNAGNGRSHTVFIDNRESLVVTDVTDVPSFSEDTVLFTLSQGGLVVRGENLHMQMLDLETGKAVLAGNVQSIAYTQKRSREKNLLARLLK